MKITVITLFPKIISEYMSLSIMNKAIKSNALELEVVDLRIYGNGKRRNVDDTVYGGGCGMVIAVDVLDRALSDVIKNSNGNTKIFMTSPKGFKYTQKDAQKIIEAYSHIVIICGHYEGIDQRIYSLYDIEDISIGDYILTGGEVAALAIIDSVTRLLPNVLKKDATINETFNENLLEQSQYTKPAVYKGFKVPEVLMSGNHAQIEEYRKAERIQITKLKRPELLKEGGIKNGFNKSN